MSARALPVGSILAAGVGMGVAGDHLLRAPGDPGLNFVLLFLGLAAAVWLVCRSARHTLDREAWTCVGLGVLFGAALAWRGSGLVRFVAFVAACTAFTLPALHAGRAWVRRSGVFDVMEAIAGAGIAAAVGAVRLFGPEQRKAGTDGPSRGVRRVARIALGGAALALVPLIVFGSLLASADQVFATLLGDLVSVDLEALAGHLIATVVLTWLVCGYLVGVVGGTRLDAVRPLLPDRPAPGVAEVATAMALVDLLFLGFVSVQFRYLFGGSAWVEVTPGLTYAAYARAGFFQLVAAVALAIPWLLVTHSLVGDRGFRGRTAFTALASFHLLLLFAVVASAVQRMLVYQAAYGLTEERLVVLAVLAWLTVVLVWFAATVLGGRQNRFAFGALASAFVLVGALQIANPAARVARYNIEHASELGGVDAEHLGSLGSDAVPYLLSRFDELPEDVRCVLSHHLVRLWGPSGETDWRSFNLADGRARRAVAMNLAALRRASSARNCG